MTFLYPCRGTVCSSATAWAQESSGSTEASSAAASVSTLALRAIRSLDVRTVGPAKLGVGGETAFKLRIVGESTLWAEGLATYPISLPLPSAQVELHWFDNEGAPSYDPAAPHLPSIDNAVGFTVEPAGMISGVAPVHFRAAVRAQSVAQVSTDDHLVLWSGVQVSVTVLVAADHCLPTSCLPMRATIPISGLSSPRYCTLRAPVRRTLQLLCALRRTCEQLGRVPGRIRLSRLASCAHGLLCPRSAAPVELAPAATASYDGRAARRGCGHGSRAYRM